MTVATALAVSWNPLINSKIKTAPINTIASNDMLQWRIKKSIFYAKDACANSSGCMSSYYNYKHTLHKTYPAYQKKRGKCHYLTNVTSPATSTSLPSGHWMRA